ncbi:MAG TPA: bacillithiol biosynthesis deacetylase BshB1 [Sedimentisphaerales bacterium]|nr:bacillithiol biosynthesis deacetylase BshB1 [Sedimentisphaerales bacterium]
MKKIMIVAPHPDDAELAMGGAIAGMIDAGWDVTIVDLTDGEPTPFGSKELRKQETDKANEILGIRKRLCLDMPNRYLQATLENRRKLAEVIRRHQPDVLFGPVKPDYHPDHVAAADLIVAARFEAKFHKTDMQGEPHWVSRQYHYYSIHRGHYNKPSFIIDITSHWQKKIDAIAAYESQLKNTGAEPLAFLEKMETIGRYFGCCIGCKYGEPFAADDPLPIKQMMSLADLC